MLGSFTMCNEILAILLDYFFKYKIQKNGYGDSTLKKEDVLKRNQCKTLQ